MDQPVNNLLPIEDMPKLQGMDVPGSFYVVSQKPVCLAGMKFPGKDTPWNNIYQYGLHFVISLAGRIPDYDPAPLVPAGYFPLEDLYLGRLPSKPLEEYQLIDQATRCAMELIGRKAGVVVHCEGGTGRTGTVIGCVLKCLGYNSVRVINYLDELNRSRGIGNGWPESNWQAMVVRRYNEPSSERC